MAAPVADLGTGVLEMFAGLEDDERLAGHGLAAAFAAAFPSLPADSDIPSLTTSTSWARVAGLLGVSSLAGKPPCVVLAIVSFLTFRPLGPFSLDVDPLS